MNNDVIETRYYKIMTNRRGRRVLITKKKILANSLSFATELKVYIFDDEDGTKIYSIDCDERVEKIAEQLCQWHKEALWLNRQSNK